MDRGVVDQQHALYCLGNPVFYDSAILHLSEKEEFDLARCPAPEGWAKLKTGDWVEYDPLDNRLPAQGWKIHASACTESAEEILRVVWDYCMPRRIAFKFMRSQQLLFLRNAKYANRAGSGKFVTIYPADEAQFARGHRRPRGAARRPAGPVHPQRPALGRGTAVRALRRLRGAPLRRDRRRARDRDRERGRRARARPPRRDVLRAAVGHAARVPAPHLDARNSSTVDELPYDIKRALHFSNGGGVYEGVVRATGERVVLKEARPYAGLALDGEDAVTRLGRERDMLTLLDGTGVPAVHDYFTVAEHHFLVMEFVEGDSLNHHLVARCPAAWGDADSAALAEYTGWALDVLAALERTVAAVHERGVIVNDMHPANVLVRPDGQIALIDMETAFREGEDRVQTMADPGFMAPRGSRGYDIDRYALACLRLFAFMPLTDLFALDASKARRLADEIARLFPVPRAFLDEAVETIVSARAADPTPLNPAPEPISLEPDATSWHAARDSMARAILASATPERDDRLFPGAIEQFQTGGGLNVAYGAAGVLHALHATGAGRHPEHEEWLVRAALNPQPGCSLGFYDGLHGIAYVLDALGRRDDARALLDICLSELDGKHDRLGLNLFSGLSGIGLNLAHFAAASADSSLWEATLRVADIVAGRLGDVDGVARSAAASTRTPG